MKVEKDICVIVLQTVRVEVEVEVEAERVVRTEKAGKMKRASGRVEDLCISSCAPPECAYESCSCRQTCRCRKDT